MRLKSSALAAFILLVLPTPGNTDIYKIIRPDGRTVFTDRPEGNGRYQLYLSTRQKSYRQDLKQATGNREKLLPYIQAVASRHQIDAELLHAIIHTESAYNPLAVSRAGAIGLMQLMPATARRYGVNDPYDIQQNLEGGVRYLKDLLQLFKQDLRLALAGYNAGEGAVIKYQNHIPPYPETREYVDLVMRRLGA